MTESRLHSKTLGTTLRAGHLTNKSCIMSSPAGSTLSHAIISCTMRYWFFLDKASEDTADVQQLADSTTIALSSMGTENPSVDQYRYESRVLFAVSFAIITQLNAAATQQDHLIKLVLSLRRVPFPAAVAQDIDPRDMYYSMNEGLGNLIDVLADFEHDAPMHSRLEDRPCNRYGLRKHQPWRQRYLTGGGWGSINTLIARLLTAAPDLTRLDIRALLAMIEALEQPCTPSQLEDVLPAAAGWIVYAGKALRSNDVGFADMDDDGSRSFPGSKGELWTGQHGFNRARWDSWMQLFKGIAERSDVSNTVRQAAQHALEAGL